MTGRRRNKKKDDAREVTSTEVIAESAVVAEPVAAEPVEGETDVDLAVQREIERQIAHESAIAEAEPDEAQLDEAVARAGEDPLGPATDLEGESPEIAAAELEGEADPEDAPLDDDERPGLEKAPPLLVSDKHLETVIESLLFVSDKPMTAQRVARIARTSTKEAARIIHSLVEHYLGRGIELIEVAGGYQFRSTASSAPFVRDLVAKKPVRLTRAQIETLSISAYRQPITRPEVDDIRGVDSGSAIKVLVEKSLLKILGRKDEPGRPLLYGTTPYFLEFFGLPSLAELPTLREHAELTDESRELFARRMGESIDTIGDIEGDAHHYTDEEIEAAEHSARVVDQDEQGALPLDPDVTPAPNAPDDEEDAKPAVSDEDEDDDDDEDDEDEDDDE